MPNCDPWDRFDIFIIFQGCLKPVKVIIPKGSILDPSENAAVVGGNVLTSQRIVDVIFKAFGTCAASQVCPLARKAPKKQTAKLRLQNFKKLPI